MPRTKRQTEEPVSFNMKMPESMKDEIQAFANRTGEDMSSVARRGIMLAMKGGGTDSFAVPILTKAKCGNWEEALRHSTEFILNQGMADELEMRDGDVFVRASGDSMEGAGILDGALILMRPLDEHRVPRRGEIALVQVQTGEDDYQATIKHWNGGEPPKLTDGEGNDFSLPDDVIGVRAVAVARAVIARL